MKLIHLPTGEEFDIPNGMGRHKLRNYPYKWVRAELPEHWRVEGYDKSWEWAELDEINPPTEHVYCDRRREKSKGCCTYNSIIYLNTFPISRAEFEHHIYNPWKASQTIEFKASRETPMLWAVDPVDGIFKPVSALKDPNEQLDMSDINMLKQQAEKMGFELVPVKKERIAWDMEENSYVMHDGGVTIKDESDQQTVWLENAEIETLIEKYNQFHATPTT